MNNLYGSSIVGSDGTWNIDANGVKALTLLKEMYDNKSIDAGFDMAAADELQKFQQETCAMTFCFGTSAEITYASEDYTQIAVPFPSEDGKPSLEYLVNGCLLYTSFMVLQKRNTLVSPTSQASARSVMDINSTSLGCCRI